MKKNMKRFYEQTEIDDYYYNRKKLNLTPNAIKVLEKRYLKRDEEGVLLEKPIDMFIRVAKNIVSAEKNYTKTEKEIKKIERDFFDIMTDLDFLPNSPTLMNAGRELQQLAACFVLPVGDSMDSIFETLKETALIQKSGGGVGYSFSNIRPKNDVVLSTKGISSGPISFMTVFNAATDTIKQGGTRRGANMGILRVDHPDILEFITSKEENDKLNNFNISVGVTEVFMKAVENDDEYDIVNPRTKEVVSRYRARDVFNKIVTNAWKNGDPGIIFLDRLNKDNPTPHIGEIESTNPCVSKDSLISTDRGFIRAEDLHDMIQRGENIKILFDRRALDFKISGKFNSCNLDILESSSLSSWDRGKKDVYRLTTHSGYELEATADHKVLTIKGYKKLLELKEDDEILIQPLGKFNLGIKSNILTRKYSFSRGFSYINSREEEKSYRALDDNYYEPFISGGISKKRFQQEIGVLADRKNKLLDSFKFESLSSDNYYNKSIDKVKSVKYIGKKKVYDFNEPISNSFIANGIVVRNCGEQPLLPYEACNLGSINLSHMVKEEAGKVVIDYEKLKKVVHISVRFLDDVIDMNRYPLEKIEKMATGNRKIGLGVMGFSDMLILLGIPYDSEEALEVAQNVMSFIQDESKEASKKLAEERGVFPNFKGSIYDSPDGYEIRNATTTTIAPTGTLSIIAGCSSGIEPLFAVSFVRKVLDNQRLVEVNPHFEEIAKRERFYSKELMEKIAESGNPKDIDEVPQRYKRIFVTAHEVTPIWHVRMQAAFQKFVDNAVSKTVNFPYSAEVKDVEEVYILAYRLGCKGITIFRDRSRQSQVLMVEKKEKKEENISDKDIEAKKEEKMDIEEKEAVKEKISEPSASKELHEDKEAEEKEKVAFGKIKPRPRPEITKGMTKKYLIGGCGKLYVTVNSDEFGICEVFTNTGEEGCAALSEAISRLISIAIRSGIDIESIRKQIKGIRCITCIADRNTHVLSCPDAISKALEFYIEGYNKFDLDIASGPRSVMICPEEGCGGVMEPEGGCYVCRNCGFSKCS